MFNPAREPWSDKRVRQAVMYAIDKDEIMLGTSFGFGEVTNQQFTERTGWNPGVPDRWREKNLEKARALLKEAGYPDGFSDVMPVTSTYRQLKDAAQIIQAQVAEVGINLKLEIYDWGAWIDLATKCEYGISNCGMSQFSDPDLLYPSFWPMKSAFNWFMGNAYNNPEADELLAKAGAIMDREKRLEYYKKFVEIVNEDVPFSYYGCHTMPCGWRDYVKGFEPHLAQHYNYANGGFMTTWLDK
jgi:peptide/nickel transport system substrate-binding protein